MRAPNSDDSWKPTLDVIRRNTDSDFTNCTERGALLAADRHPRPICYQLPKSFSKREAATGVDFAFTSHELSLPGERKVPRAPR